MANIIFETDFPSGPAIPSATSGNGLGNDTWEFQKKVQFDAGVTFLGGTTGGSLNVINSNAATLTLTAAQTGSIVLLNRAAGTTVTLPAPAAGLKFVFIAPVSVTSNNYKIITDAGTTFLLGQINVFVSTGTAKYFLGDGSTAVAVTMNGTTTGGLAGTRLTFECISGTVWNVDGNTEGSGTVATPFTTS